MPPGFQPVKVGVIGTGRFGRLHALTLAGLTEFQLVAIVGRRPEYPQPLKSELPDVPYWSNLPTALSQSGAEAWVVACTTSAHIEITRTLLEAGLTVLLEKPLADSLDDALSLQHLVLPDSRNLMLGHILLFNSEFQQLQLEVANRGKLTYVDCVRHRPASIPAAFPGETPLESTMVHDLYCLQTLTNREHPQSLTATKHDNTDGAIDLVHACLQWPNGLIATCTASFLTPAGMPPRGFDRMEVFGDGWAARIQPNPRPIDVWAESAIWPMALEIRAVTTGPPTGMLAEELRTFSRVVRRSAEVPIGARYADALQVQQWIETLAHSAGLVLRLP